MRCTRGAIFDVVVDLRPDSETYCRWFGVELRAGRRASLFIPAGLAHGFQTLEDETEVHYQMTDHYVPEAARGVRWDDPAFGIEWPAAAGRRRCPSATPPIPTSRGEARPRHRAPAASSAAGRSRRCARARVRGAVPRHARDLLDAAAGRERRDRGGAADAPAAPRVVRRARRVLDVAGEPRWVAATLRCCARSRRRRQRAVLAGHLRRVRTGGRDALRRGRHAAGAGDALRDGQGRAAPGRRARRGRASAWGRVFFLYGPHEHPARLAPRWRRLRRGEPAETSRGTQIRDFLHAEDVAAAFVALLDHGRGRREPRLRRPPPVARDRELFGEAAGRPELLRSAPGRRIRPSPPRSPRPSIACATRSAGPRRERSSSASPTRSPGGGSARLARPR